jgi:hypothetical protein
LVAVTLKTKAAWLLPEPLSQIAIANPAKEQNFSLIFYFS